MTALNANGESVFSNSLDIFACGVPSQPMPVFKISSTSTSLNVGWKEPEYDGGCPILGYNLMHDGGDGGDLDVQADASLLTNPYLHSKSLSPLTTGALYRFNIIAINDEGTSTSSISAFIVAQVPDAPTNPPTVLEAESTLNFITVTVDPFDPSENGGSTIIGYEIQIDDGNRGLYHTVQGGEDRRTVATKAQIYEDFVKSRTY